MGQGLNVLLEQADSLLHWNQTQEAEALLTKIEASLITPSDHQTQLMILKTSLLMKRGLYEDAFKVLKRIGHSARDKVDILPEQQAFILLYTGQYHFRMRASALSIEALQQALAISNNTRLKNNLQSSILNWMGNVHKYRTYDYDSALIFYKRALQSWEKNQKGDPLGLARIYVNLSTTYRSLNAFVPAKTYANNALNIAQKYRSINEPFYASCLSSLGNIAYSLSQYREATAYYQKITALTEVTQDRGSPQLTTYYQNIGTLFLEQQQYDSALKYHRRSLELTVAYETSEESLVHILVDVGTDHLLLKTFDSAHFYFSRAGQLLATNKALSTAARTRAIKGLGDMYAQQSLYDSALNYYQKGLHAQVKGFSDPSFRNNPKLTLVEHQFDAVSLLNAKGKAMLQMYFQDLKDVELLDKSLETLHLAEQVTSRFRGQVSEYDFNTILSDHVFELHENTLLATVLKHEQTPSLALLEEVYSLMERSKSLHLLKSLMSAYSYGDVGVNKESTQYEIQISRQLTAKLEELAVAQQSKESNIGSNDQLLQELITLQLASDSISQVLRKTSPQYSAIKHTLIQHNLTDVQQFSKQNQSQVLGYFMGSNYLFVLVINPDTVRVHYDKVEPELIGHLNSVMRGLREGPNISSLDIDLKAYTESASFLYDQLVSPVINPKYPQVTIVPNNTLAYLPFDALVSSGDLPKASFKNLNYLIHDYSIGYAYSLELLLRNENHASKDAKVLALSYAERESWDNVSPAQRSKNYSKIPGTAKELRSISQSFEGEYLYGTESSETAFKRLADHYNILHLAVHGVGENEDNTLPHLVFRTENDSLNDGFLYPYEVFNSQYNADLVVLSGCQTGTGKHLRGEGVYSMARAFSYAGVPSTIMSLWSVNDQATTQLIDSFYKGLSIGKPIKDALRESKLTFLAATDPISAHPTNWAALVPLGSNRALIEESPTLWYVTLLMVLVIGVGYLWYRSPDK